MQFVVCYRSGSERRQIHSPLLPLSLSFFAFVMHAFPLTSLASCVAFGFRPIPFESPTQEHIAQAMKDEEQEPGARLVADHAVKMNGDLPGTQLAANRLISKNAE